MTVELALFSGLRILKDVIDDKYLKLPLLVKAKVKHVHQELEKIFNFLTKAGALRREIEGSNAFAGMRDDAFCLERAVVDFGSKAASSPNSIVGKIYHNKAAELELLKVTEHFSSLSKKVNLLKSRESLEHDPNPAYPDFVEQDELVRLEGKKDKLAKQLMDEDSPPIICVYGMGGYGKTTLAKNVYQDAEVRRQFDSFAWAEVSKKLSGLSQARDLWEELLVELSSLSAEEKKMLETMRDEEIAKMLFDTLKRQKCFVVLDGLANFELEMWSCLKPAFFQEETRSRILITTRMTNEAKLAERQKDLFLFELQRLNEEESWELFAKLIHFKNYAPKRPADARVMRELGGEMVKYCDGLPLAITVLTGLLLSTRTKVYEWERLCLSMKMRKERVPDESGLWLVLNLSYDEMPVQLKHCFLHLAHFPENFEIRAKELCQIWIAEQFVPFSKSKEEGAYECLSKLVKRRMVQVRRWGSRGRIKTCCLHDFTRGFCLSKAESDGFLCVVNCRGIIQEDKAMRGSPTCERLAIYLKGDTDAELLPLVNKRDDSLRSFICFNPAPYPYYEQVMKPLFNNFRKLRILKFENITRGYAGQLPKEIGKLRHLGLLSLKNSHVEQLPSSIGRLKNLQCLDLKTNWILELPKEIEELARLRHLYLPHRSTLKHDNKLRLENLSSLQTLIGISTNYFDLKDLMHLINLKKLKVHVNDATHLEKAFKIQSLAFDHLQSLAVENCSQARIDMTPFIANCYKLHKLDVEGKISKLPEKIDEFPSKLMKLRLKQTCLENDPMATLEKLENLKILCLDYNSFEGDKMVCSSGGFHRLESLSLVGLGNLQEWRVEKKALAKLRHLCINYCYKLKAVPDDLRNLTSLKEVVVQRMPARFKMMLKEDGRNVTSIEPLD